VPKNTRMNAPTMGKGAEMKQRRDVVRGGRVDSEMHCMTAIEEEVWVGAEKG
jgi:hypothetical protein